MIMKLLKAEGLAQHTYFIGSQGEAVVIDPRREPGDLAACLDLARQHCMTIKYVLETHRNEDFVHGSQEIAHATGAAVRHGAGLPFRYGEPILDGEAVKCGTLRLAALETPGHTPESLTYVLYDSANEEVPVAAFTGDTLFVGSTGRIDLPGRELRAANAGKLYDSIHRKILPLGDHVALFPGHGAGSVCGSGIGDRDWSTIGYERQANPHLALERDAFVRRKTEEKLVRPTYFRTMEDYNLNGPPALDARQSPRGMGLDEFREAMEKPAHGVVDTRLPQGFGGGHVPGCFNIWLEGMALFPGWVFAPEDRILLITERNADAQDADRYLCRIGYDHVVGHLCGGFETWQNAGLPVAHTGEISVDALKELLSGNAIAVVDVREPREWDQGTVPGAQRIYVGELSDRIGDVPQDKPVATMCTVGHRGSLGASVLQRAGRLNVYNVLGGSAAWTKRQYQMVKPD